MGAREACWIVQCDCRICQEGVGVAVNRWTASATSTLDHDSHFPLRASPTETSMYHSLRRATVSTVWVWSQSMTLSSRDLAADDDTSHTRPVSPCAKQNLLAPLASMPPRAVLHSPSSQHGMACLFRDFRSARVLTSLLGRWEAFATTYFFNTPSSRFWSRKCGS